MNRFERVLHRSVRSRAAVPHGRPPRERPELILPGDRSATPVLRAGIAYLASIAVPCIVAVLLVPLRTDHIAAAALILVVPVVVIAAVGTTGPAVVAAASAALSFDLFLTEPYYHFAISDPDDIVAALTLGVVGLVVGMLSTRLGRLAARDDARRSELDHLIAFIGEADEAQSADELSVLVCGHLVDLLGLRRCEWLPHVDEANGPVLLPSGALMGRLTELDPDRGRLPHHVMLPIATGVRQRGCFLMTTDRKRLTSLEERRTAATIGGLFSKSQRVLPAQGGGSIQT